MTFTVFSYLEYCKLVNSMKLTTSVFDIEKQAKYIYVNDKQYDIIKNSINSKNEYISTKVSWMFTRLTDSKYALLKLANSHLLNIRLQAIDTLASNHKWNDCDICSISQAANSRTMIGLARSNHAPLSMFRHNAKLIPSKRPVVEEFKLLLRNMPRSISPDHISTNYLTQRAVRSSQSVQRHGHQLSRTESTSEFTQSSGIANGNNKGSSNEDRENEPQYRIIHNCLEAIHAYSKDESNLVEMVNLGLLSMLHRCLYDHYSETIPTPRIPLTRKSSNNNITNTEYAINILNQKLIAKIIANVSCNINLHSHLISTGWIHQLALWLRSEDSLALKLIANKTLLHLDKDCGSNLKRNTKRFGYNTLNTCIPPFANITNPHYDDSSFKATNISKMLTNSSLPSSPTTKTNNSSDDKATSSFNITSQPAIYTDGIYTCSYIYRNRSDIDIDVVFVHGLLGDPFRTWRSRDYNHASKSSPESSSSTSYQAKPTLIPKMAAMLKKDIADRLTEDTFMIEEYSDYEARLKREKFFSQNNEIRGARKDEDSTEKLLVNNKKNILKSFLSRLSKKKKQYVDEVEPGLNRETSINDISFEKENRFVVKEKRTKNEISNYDITNCWPMDWLANDNPNMRVIVVEYSTNITNWTLNSPLDEDMRTLNSQAFDLLEKLKKAGIGQRKTILIGHSMGGLLIKQMLLISEDQANQSLGKTISSQTISSSNSTVASISKMFSKIFNYSKLNIIKDNKDKAIQSESSPIYNRSPLTSNKASLNQSEQSKQYNSKHVNSKQIDGKHFSSCLANQTKACIFYGVPNHGTHLINFKKSHTKAFRYILSPSVQVNQLQYESAYLENLHTSFKRIMTEQNIKLLSFGEGSSLKLPLNYETILVPRESSDPGFGHYILMENINHLNICKPSNKQSILYKLTKTFIELFCNDENAEEVEA